MYSPSIRLATADSSKLKKNVALLICPVFEAEKKKKLSFSKTQLELLGFSMSKLLEWTDFNEFEGKKGQTLLVAPNKKSKADKIMLVGCGKEEDFDQISIEKAGAALFDRLKDVSVKEAHIVFPFKSVKLEKDAFYKAYMTGLLLKSYRFDTYKKANADAKKMTLTKVTAFSTDHKELGLVAKEVEAIAEGVFVARSLTNEPPNYLRPDMYAENLKKLFKGTDVKVTALGEKKLQAMGANLFLSVGQASTSESHMVLLEYNGLKGKSKKGSKPYAFVGKGICFDTGGNNIKSFDGMLGMKADMGGSAVVVGLLKSLAARKAPVHVIGAVALAENMVSGNASRPTDVVTSLSGKTVEILNTDAEGRLVLADTMTYVQQKYKPSHLIDLATLTGAIIMALGGEYAGLFSNDDGLSDTLTQSGIAANEPVWRLPLCEAYDKALESEVADMTNLGKRALGAGSATAGAFLKAFVEKDVKWAHLDIAGTTMIKGSWAHLDKGATGYGVRLLNQFIDTQTA